MKCDKVTRGWCVFVKFKIVRANFNVFHKSTYSLRLKLTSPFTQVLIAVKRQLLSGGMSILTRSTSRSIPRGMVDLMTGDEGLSSEGLATPLLSLKSLDSH